MTPADWLASAHHAPEAARREWSTGGIALIPTGRAFDAVRLSSDIVHSAAGSAPETVAAILGELLDGPVIHDAYQPGRWYYALVEVGACTQLKALDAFRLDPGTWLGVPAIDRTGRPGAYWVRPPQHREDWCDPAGVAELIRLARTVLDQRGELGSAGPELGSIEQTCRELLAEQCTSEPTYEDASDSVMRARGCLMVVLPVLEDAVARLPLSDRTRSRAPVVIARAHEHLAQDCSSVNLARQYAHVQRLARCCLEQVDLLRELDASAVAR
ncbi:DUF6415 family natural product biosynthesis protein [Streptomyces sp. NPDC051597]|uniref:DUF6415 family natural product biosynthesis protein n=1 Tax=Streptomyces sp. NPDC051597 TaxID=3155049 RepID=UPI003412F22E